MFGEVGAAWYPAAPQSTRDLREHSSSGTGPGIQCHLVHSTLFLFGVLILFACSPRPQVFGTLEGHVTIGPLVPVVRDGEPEPTPAPEVYAAREIVVFEENGRTEFIRLRIDTNGNYRAELPVGIYVVDINHIGIDSAANLPKKIVIAEQGVTRLDIDIDTGIR